MNISNTPDDQTIPQLVNNSQAFFAQVTTIVNECKTSYIDAVMHYCTANDIEIEVVAKLIRGNPTLKTLIENEGQSLNFLKKTAKLPV